MKKLFILLILILTPFLQSFAPINYPGITPDYQPTIEATCVGIRGIWYMPETSYGGYMYLVIVYDNDIDEVILKNTSIAPANAFIYETEYRSAPGSVVTHGWVVSEDKNYPIGNLPYNIPSCSAFFPYVGTGHNVAIK